MSFATLTVHDFLTTLARPEPTPGGGTAAAIAGAMGAALLMMVAGLARTRGNTDAERAALAEARGHLEPLADGLERVADADARAYDEVMAAYRLPKSSDEEKARRKTLIATALRAATEAPLETLRLAADALAVGESVARFGNPSAASDVRVAGGLLNAAAEGAAANVLINLDGLADDSYKAKVSADLEKWLARARASGAAVAAATA